MESKTILIVDDEEKNIKLLKRMLKSENYNLFGALSGEEGLKMVTDISPDLILLDVLMPGIDGFEVCRRLKKDKKTRIIPVIMVAVLEKKEHRLEAMEAGADDFLSIPVDKTELLVRVKSLLRIKSYHDALLESEEKYRLHLENVSDVIFAIDPDFRVTSVSPSVERILGHKPEELIGRPFQDLNVLAPDYLEKAFSQTMRVLEGELTAPSIYEFICKDGTRKFGEVSAAPLFRDGEVIAMISVARDVTERKQAEEALRESEEKYRTVLEANPDPVVVYDMEGKVVYFNPAFTRVLGWTLEERFGKKMDVFVPDEAWPETKMMIDKVLAGESFSGIETRRYTKDGKIVPVSLSGAIYRDQDGNPVGSVINIRDISEQKKIEAQLLQSQRMEAVYTLAGGIAHDFNNLLSGIHGRASLMMMDIDSSHPHFEHLAGIDKYVKSAVQLTKQLLGFARGGKYEVKSVDINEIVEKSSKMFGRTKKEIRVHRENQKNIWAAEVDPGQIEQVLLNLYVNAWHAMPGGGDLYIQTKNVIIDENYIKPYKVEPGRYVTISVTDTGVGMDKATQKRIFEPFFTTKEMGRGTGLGLASVYGIIKNHGGFINVYSEKGEGATFNIYLPASKEKVIEEEKVLSKTVLKGSETILLVDDEDMIIDATQDILKLLGYNVLVAKGGKKAIQVYKKNQEKIDMVILDMIMPGMNGGEVYVKLKEINPGVKVLLSSGYSLNEQATEIMERGCNGFIQKPFNMMDISEKIREILDKNG